MKRVHFTRAQIIRTLRQHGDVLKRYRVRRIGLFGSYATGRPRRTSDIDLLVEFEPGRSLLDQAALGLDLEELLGRKVDIVTEGGLYWLLRRRILREARAL